MDHGGFDLSWLLDPITKEAFFSEFYEQRPLHLRRAAPNHFAGLIAPTDLDFLVAGLDLSLSDRRASRIRLVKKNTELPQKAFIRPDGHADLDRVYAAYQEGHTLVLNGLHGRSPSTWALCRNLERRLGHPCGANLYLTPPDEQGFGIHYDTHDVFFLQLTGSKRWRLYAPAIPLPFDAHLEHRPEAFHGELLEELELETGDLLYIPRGFAHDGSSAARASMHLSVHIKAYSYLDALSAALSAMALSDLRFRRAIPVGFGEPGGVDDLARRTFAELLRDFAAGAGADEAFRLMQRRFEDERFQWPDARWDAPLGLSGVTVDTTLRRPPGVICRLTEEPGAVIFHRAGRSLRCPAFIAPALRFVAESTSFTARALPGGLDEASRLLLVRRLIEQGYLFIGNDG